MWTWIKKHKFRLSGLLALVIFLGLFVAPWFLNPDYLRSLALRQIQQTFGPHVSVGTTKFSLFPQPHFLVNNITVKDRPEAHAVFRARTISLELGIGQLLQKRLVVREFVLDHPEIEVHRNRTGEWVFLGHSGGSSPIVSLAQFLVLGKFVVLNGKIIVIDESPQDVVQGFVLDEVICRTETQQEGASIVTNVELAGILRQNSQVSPFHIQGDLHARVNSDLSANGNDSLPFKEMNFTGNIVANDVELRQFSRYVSNGNVLERFSDPLKIETQVTWKQDATSFQLHFGNIALTSQAMSFSGNANIDGLADGHQMFGVTMRSSTLPLKMLRPYVPRSWVPEEIQESWNRGKMGGELNIEEARVTASTREDVDTSVTGVFRLDNGFLYLPNLPKTEQFHGTVHIEPDRIHVVDGQGVYDNIPVRLNRGILLFKETGPFGDIEIQGRVPATKVSQFVKDLQGRPGSSGVLEAWKALEGQGELRLGFSGNFLDPKGLLFQYGDYEFQDVVLRIPSLPQDVSHGKGKILFSRSSTVFEEVEGLLGSYPWRLGGTINHAKESRFEGLQLSFGMDGKELFPGATQADPGAAPPIIGPIKVVATLQGATTHPKVKAQLNLQETRLDFPLVLSKQSGLPATVEIEGKVISTNTFRFTRIEWDMLPLKLHGQGVMRKGRNWVWEGRLDSSPIYIGLLPEGLRVMGGLIDSGILEIQLGGRGSGPDWRNWDFKGWVALTEGLISIRGLSNPITNLFVRVKIDKELLDIKRVQFRIKDSEGAVTGFVKNWRTTPAVSAMFEAPEFDLDLLVPKEDRSVLRDGVEWLAAHGTLEGSIVVDRPRYKTMNGQKLSGTLKVHDNLVILDKVQMLVGDDGTLGGRMFIHVPEGKPAALRASFNGERIPFDKLLSTFGDENRLITGKADIQGKIQGHGRDPEGVFPTLNGHMKVTIREGNVRKGKVIPRILTLLNLPSVLRGKVKFKEEGFRFKKIRTNIQIENGIFTSNDLVVRSPIMHMTAIGDYDLPEDKLDVAAAVSPFGPYSQLIKKIPLFGRIFAGKRKGIATAVFTVKGHLNSPRVKYLPLESWKTRLTSLPHLAFDILKNIVTMPYDIIKDAKDSSKQSPKSPPTSTSPNPDG